ncbi:MAG: hypothetical protein KDD40_00505 [Bdellovibrionales bacterium]|nr:hypothetical protein [Bdellovibrionales bacterium]
MIKLIHYSVMIFIILPLWVMAEESGYTVCTATVNSPQERESFKQHLSGKNFNFIELTDYTEAKSKDERGSDWFDKACEAGVKCDVLVISGHFGGHFFGFLGFSLETNMMEEKSCQKTCSGILSQPKEVFLFGCNTLATKEKDHRSPQEYLRVLIEDGIDRDDAERIVQARYGALGDSYKDRMRRIFSGVKHIYGFDSVGPSGKTVKPFLDRYFKRIPEYQNHLLKMDMENIVNIVEKANLQVQDMNNTVLAEVLTGTAFAQCSGITEEDSAYHLKKEICQLYDWNLSTTDQINAIERMLMSENKLLFFPSISAYFKKNPQILEDDEVKKTLLTIGSDLKLKKEIENLLVSLEGSPTLQIDIMHLQWVLGWKTRKQFEADIKLLLKDTLKNLNRENIDIICSLQENNILELNVAYEDFNPSQIRSSIGVTVFNCVKTDDQRITREVIKSFDKPSSEHLFGMLGAAPNLPGYNEEFQKIAKKYMTAMFPWAEQASGRLLLYKGTRDQQLQQVKKFLNEKNDVWMVATFIHSSSLKDDGVGRLALKKLLQNPPDITKSALTQVLANTLDSNSPVWKEVGEEMKIVDTHLNSGVAAHIAVRDQITNNPHLTQWSLDNILNPRNTDTYYPFISIAAHSTLNIDQARRALTFIRENPEDVKTTYLRWVIKEQSDLKLSEDDKKLLEGVTNKYECRETEPGSYYCG